MIDRIGRAYGINSLSKAKKSDKVNDVKSNDKGDGLQVSSFGQVMSKAMSDLKKIPDVRQDKVESIRNQIESGDYKPDMDSLAAKLIQIGLIEEKD